MTKLPQDGEFGTYGERRPRIVKKSMKVGEQDVGLEGRAPADLRKETEKLQAEARAEREQYLSLIKQVEDPLAGADKEPDWEGLRNQLPPEEYANARDQWAQREKDRKAAANERARVEKKK